jgi:N-acetylmuramic acid 6-phosphate etherase
VYHYDRDGLWPRLGQKILSALAMNSPEELIGWVQQAAKAEIASFTVHVFSAAAEGDKIARDILAAAADSLARDAAACAAKLAAKKQPIKFVLAGSVLIKQPAFAKKVVQEIKKLWPRAVITRLKRPGVDGAVELARRQFAKSGAAAAEIKCVPKIAGNNPPTPGAAPGLSKSPTEQRNPLSLHIDKMPVSEAIELMLRADKKIPQAILAERKKIERAVRWIAQAFRQGGRLIYVGAGTSGRLGILDASECPPTFRTQPEMVQGIIAGGQTAIWKAVEGAEDKFEDGIDSIRFRGVTRMDVVVGIAASGRTPFVLGALRAAKKIGAKTVLICFNPGIEFARAARPDLIIAPNIGPELLTGSTRLKAGTATKLILNILTTLAMVQIGKVISNLMIDLNPSNVKLRDRAVRIIQELTGVNAERAERSLEKSGWVIKDAWQQLK